MLTGQVGVVCDSRGWVGKLVQWVQRSRAHHVVIALSETHCISAEPGGSRKRLISDYETVVWSRYPHTADKAHRIAGLADMDVGIRYDYLSFFTLGVHFLTGWPIPNPVADWLNSRGETTCSQLAEQIMAIASVDRPTTRVVCPADWLNYIQTHH